MRRKTTLLLLLIAIIISVFSATSITASADEEQEFTAVQLSLGYNIGMTYYTNVDYASDVTAEITINGRTDKIKAANVNNKSVFSFSGIAPHELGSEIMTEVYKGNTAIGLENTTAVNQICSLYLDNSFSEYSEETRDGIYKLVSNLLQYGECARIYKNVPDSILTDITSENYTPDILGAPTGDKTTGSGNENLSLRGLNVFFDTTNRYYVRFATTDISKVRFTVDSTAYTEFGEEGGYYFFYTNPMSAKDTNNVIPIKGYYDGNKAIELNYSIEQYIIDLAAVSASTNIQNLAKSIYNYGESAQAYTQLSFETNNNESTGDSTEEPPEDIPYVASEGLDYWDLGYGYYVCGRGSCEDTEIYIPREYEGMPVIGIDDGAFSCDYELEKIYIPGSVEYIGCCAFEYNENLQELIMEDCDTELCIYDGAFLGCYSLTEVVIPEGTLEIYCDAFGECLSLESVAIPSTIEYMDSAFWSLDCLETVTYNGSVTDFIVVAEYNDELLEVYLQDYLVCVDDVYYIIPLVDSCILYDVDNSISGDVIIPDSFEIDEITLPLVALHDNSFSNCQEMTSVVVPDGVTSIGSYAFGNCTNLESIDLPNSVTVIGVYAFHDSAITEIDIPDGVIDLSWTFSNCKMLTTVSEIPEGVTSLYYTFYGCESLETAPDIPEGVTSLYYTFCGCESLETAPDIPDTVTSMNSTFYNCKMLTTVSEIPEGVTSLYQTFGNCISLMSVVVNANPTDYYHCFYGCGDGSEWISITGESEILYALKETQGLPSTIYYGDYKYTRHGYVGERTWSVSLNTSYSGNNNDYKTNNYTYGAEVYPTTVKQTAYGKILDELFEYPVTDISAIFVYCDCMESSPEIPSSVTNMSDAFYDCTSLAEVPEIPSSVTNMSYAFYNCTSLAGVPEIPSSVTNISYAFYNCENIEEIEINANPDNYSKWVSKYSDTIISISGSTQMYDELMGEQGHPTCVYVDEYMYILNTENNTGKTAWKVELNLNFTGKSNLKSSYTCGKYVELTDKNQTEYAEVLDTLFGYGVLSMDYTFSGCTSLTTAPAIPDSVTSMERTFSECTSLTTAPAIPDSVTSMDYTFYRCRSLTTAPAIPDSVKSMINTFSGCTSLVTYHGNINTNGDFRNYTISKNVKTMNGTFEFCTQMIVAPDLSRCTKLTTMIETFRLCTSLTTPPILPSSIENLSWTFEKCYALTSAPDLSACTSLTNMSYTFTFCSSLTTPPVIPNSVTNMNETFSASGLKTVPVIPSGVKSMISTFYECHYLVSQTITINANPTSYDNCFYINWLNDDSVNIIITGSSNLLSELRDTFGINKHLVTIK